MLRDGNCVLYADEELLFRTKLVEDPNYQLTGENFYTQYIAWPMRKDLDPTVSYLLKRWIYKSLTNGTLDELFYKYFESQTCPIGMR